MRSLDLVHRHFDHAAERFDAIYESDKPLYQRIGDAVFRQVIHERYKLITNAAAAANKTVLDVGTGPGRYPIELARRGAVRCVGVDVSAEMLDIARREAEKVGVADRCEWHESDYLSWEPPLRSQRFDVVIATGYFDYLERPEQHLTKMLSQARAQVFATFPKRWELRTPLRVARFKLANGFVRFYSRGEVKSVFAAVGDVRHLSLVDLGRDYVAVYDAGAAC
jgi:2-polyprenyl-3-methyl-5-hydroxy-6-metoxy-1,4-benzoquinol methylase